MPDEIVPTADPETSAAWRALLEDGPNGIVGAPVPVVTMPIDTAIATLPEFNPPKGVYQRLIVESVERRQGPTVYLRAYRGAMSGMTGFDESRADLDMSFLLDDDKRKPEWQKRRDASAQAKAALVERMRAKRA